VLQIIILFYLFKNKFHIWICNLNKNQSTIRYSWGTLLFCVFVSTSVLFGNQLFGYWKAFFIENFNGINRYLLSQNLETLITNALKIFKSITYEEGRNLKCCILNIKNL
jgi:hypothetical protein